MGFAIVFVIAVLSIIIAGQYVPFFNFDFKDWTIFTLSSGIIFIVGFLGNALRGFKPFRA
jgi:uncharacterized protein (UPF0333 family)